PEVQIDLAPERLPMAVAVDEARQHGLSAHVNDVSAGRDRDLAAAPDRLEAVALDHDHGILDWSATGAVDQGPALHHESLRLRTMRDERGSSEQRRRQRLCDHCFLPRPFHDGRYRTNHSMVVATRPGAGCAEEKRYCFST